MTQTLEQKRQSQDFAAELRESVIAVSLHTTNVGRSRSLDTRHKAEVADHFGAERSSVASSKKLYNPHNPHVKAINAALGEARKLWERMTVPYLKGVRLLRKDQLQEWGRRFDAANAQLAKALTEADQHYQEILDESRASLGAELFNVNDYPKTFTGSIAIRWDVYNFEPSEELLKLAPSTYQREQLRVRAQFETALATYEQECKEQLSALVDSLLKTLSTPQNGKKVVFREATADNLRAFFDRFRSLNIRSDQDMVDLIDTAQAALGNTSMAELKKSGAKQADVRQAFTDVRDQLAKLTIEQPDRSISFDDLD